MSRQVDVLCPKCNKVFTEGERVDGPAFHEVEGKVDLSEIYVRFVCEDCGTDAWMYYYRTGSTEGRFTFDSLTVEELEAKMNVDARDTLIFGETIDWSKTQLEYFSALPVSVPTELIEKGFADPEETQNDSPTIQEFVEFVEVYPGCYTLMAM